MKILFSWNGYQTLWRIPSLEEAWRWRKRSPQSSTTRNRRHITSTSSRLPAQFLSLRAVAPAQERKLHRVALKLVLLANVGVLVASVLALLHSLLVQQCNSFHPLRQSLRFPSHSFHLRSLWTLRTLLSPDLWSRYRTMLTQNTRRRRKLSLLFR